MSNEINRVRNLYESQYKIDWKNWNYIWHPRNPTSLVHNHILQWALVQLINDLNISLIDKVFLDVGCGYGRILRFFIELGVSPQQAHGLDITSYRLKFCQNLSPKNLMVLGSAGELPYKNDSFDIISQFTLFSSIHDADMRQKAASEIQRILRTGGWFIWYDIKQSKGGNVFPLPFSEVTRLFTGLELKLSRPIFNLQIYRLVRRSVVLTWFWERIPFASKSGLIMAFRKSSDGNR